MKLRCPNPNCILAKNPCPKPGLFVGNGHFFRASDSKWIRRFICKSCKKSFSYSSLKPTYRQKKRRITPLLKQLLVSGVSQRRAAKILKVNPKTVVRRFRYLASEERKKQAQWVLNHYQNQPIAEIQFDDLETAEHTKCKPLSVALAVDPKTRKILSFHVSKMPAKGTLSKVALQKYGYRKDERSRGWDMLMRDLKAITHEVPTFYSDENPHYPKYVFRHHPKAVHKTTLGGRGSISGQGELKKLRFDPLFSLNHTCAMLRANLNRLFRRTWCISKTVKGLEDHLALYVAYHNQVLTPSPLPTAKGGS